jgi:signal transduction histidine kinase
LQQAKDELETRVVERTAELKQLNEELLFELARRMRAEAELRDLAGRLALIREEEKASIARAVHDELGQMLTALKMDVAWLSKRLPENDAMLLEKASAMSESISVTIRSVQRISAELRPGLLDTLGLAAALEWQAQEFHARTDIDCRLDLDVDEEALLDLNPDLTTALFRIAQESLTNVARHAQATAVHISLARQANRMSLIVRDNGKGIAPAQVADPKSLGLIGMRERLRPWQGELKIEGRPGEGTTVMVTVPL